MRLAHDLGKKEDKKQQIVKHCCVGEMIIFVKVEMFACHKLPLVRERP